MSFNSVGVVGSSLFLDPITIVCPSPDIATSSPNLSPGALPSKIWPIGPHDPLMVRRLNANAYPLPCDAPSIVVPDI